MPAHDELDQLSAYLDGELDAVELARIDAHLPSCAECRSTLDALRATLTDLATLPDPVPSEQDSWAIRSAIARSRTPVKRWQSAAWAAGTVAAGLIAFVAITHGGSNNSTGGLEAARNGNDTAALSNGRSSVAVNSLTGNFNPASAQARLLDVAGKLRGAKVAAPTGGESTTNPSAAPAPAYAYSTEGSYDAKAVAPEKQPTTALNRCVRTVTRSTTEALTPFRYELVTFESKPAFFLFFSTTDRVELWVVTQAKCEVLYFAQTA